MPHPNEKYYQALLEHRKISRRGLFRSLLKGSLQAQQQSEQAVLKRAAARPPQAVSAPFFLQNVQAVVIVFPLAPMDYFLFKKVKRAYPFQTALGRDCPMLNEGVLDCKNPQCIPLHKAMPALAS